MLTARGSEDEKVEGLEAGADDYVTKPFGTRELLARVEALGRRLRSGAESPQKIECDGCEVDLGRLVACRPDREQISLTAREAGILRWLYQHRSRAVSRAELLETVWEARGDLQTSLEIARGQAATAFALRTATDLLELELADGDPEPVRATVATLLKVFDGQSPTPDVVRARQLLSL
jgi:CheY-like chemotaxis protein